MHEYIYTKGLRASMQDTHPVIYFLQEASEAIDVRNADL
jgi:hypothetical protein